MKFYISITALILIHCVSYGDILDPIHKRAESFQELNNRLINASARGNLRQVRLLIFEGANVNALPEVLPGYMPIHEAARNGHSEVVDYLIQAGADMDARGGLYGLTPLLLAIMNNDIPTVEILIHRGARLNRFDGDNISYPLLTAVSGSHTEIVSMLIENGVFVNLANKDGVTPLLRSSQTGDTNILCLILTNDAEFRIIDNKSNNVFHYALSRENGFDTMSVLYDFAPVSAVELLNSPNEYGVTPIHLAAKYNQVEAIRFLSGIDGINFNPVTFKEYKDIPAESTPLNIAKLNGFDEITRILEMK